MAKPPLNSVAGVIFTIFFSTDFLTQEFFIVMGFCQLMKKITFCEFDCDQLWISIKSN